MLKTWMVMVMTVAGSASSAFAQQPPGWSRGQQDLAINYEECVRRAPLALKAEGYRIDHAAGAFAVGLKGYHTAIITCGPTGDGRRNLVNVIVASNGEGGGTERVQLQAQMDRSHASGGGGDQPAMPGRYLTVRVNGKQAIVDWANAPTSAGTWVSIVPVGTADDKHVGIWRYTEQKGAGRYDYSLAPGTYEARFYGDSGYGRILDRVRFDVGKAVAAGQYLSVQVNGRTAVIGWNNAPTSKGVWVSVVPAGTADDKHVGRWKYTGEAASGGYEAGGLPPGDYEARLYGDGGYGSIVDRIKFRVD